MQRNELLSQLNNLSGTAFSLQQLLIDSDTAVLETMLVLQGIPSNSNAAAILQKSFISIYSTNAKQVGHPLLSVNAVAQSVDPSQLKMTNLERGASPLVDDNGIPISNPSQPQQNATTLNYLCAVNNGQLPPAVAFNWNWVEPSDIAAESGVLAINRNVFGNFIIQQLMPSVKISCLLATAKVVAYPLQIDYSWKIETGQTPDMVIINPSGENVVHISYSQTSDSKDSWGIGASSGELRLTPEYTCDVSFSGETISVKQRLKVAVYAENTHLGAGLNTYDMILEDSYTISVDQNGSLRMGKPMSLPLEDKSEDSHASTIIQILTDIDSLLDDIKAQVVSFTKMKLQHIPFDSLQSFVFPGARVFTYKSASFSEHQDLVCNITYVNTTQDPIAQPWGKAKQRILQVNAPNNAAPKDVVSSTLQKTEDRIAQDVSSAERFDQKNLSNGSINNMTWSCELMQNYVHGEIVSPTGKFEAVQTDDGYTLLFVLSTAGVLNVIAEHDGETQNGWEVTDLSTAIISASCSAATVRTFDVGQSALDGTIGLAMVVSRDGSDHLFVSLSNSSANTSWTANPGWIPCPFDAPTKGPGVISITGVLFAETNDNQQYLMVDIDRSVDSLVRHIVRYFVDPTRTTGTVWELHDVPIDIEDGNYRSCVGRAKDATVDGVYTSGMAAGSAQLVYVPIINLFGEGPPESTRFSLPSKIPASAITAARNTDRDSQEYGSSVLYAIGGSTLFALTADEQQNEGAVGQPLLTDSLLANTDQLLSMAHNGVTTLWGRNGSDQVYYISCLNDQISVPGSWSAAVPIVTDIERISAYINREDGGNTIFASGGSSLKKLMQATGTSTKRWQMQDIKLAAPPHQPSVSFNSYTTTIKVTDTNDLPARDAELTISTPSRTPFYTNGIYYVLTQIPAAIKTDSTGSVTLIEKTDNMTGTTLTVAATNMQPITINPMQKAFSKIVSLSTSAALRDASFTANTIAGGFVGPQTTVPLVSRSLKDDDLHLVTSGIAKLNTAYRGVKRPDVQSFSTRKRRLVPASALQASSGGILGGIAIAAGDLFLWLKSGVEAVIDIVQDTVSDAWHFLATIAGQVYRAVLDTAEAIVGALEWIFNAIGTGIENLIHFVEFLFEWDDIRRTKDVMNTITRLYLLDMASAIECAKISFDKQVAATEKTLNAWAGVQDWSRLGSTATTPAITGTSNPAKGQTSGSMLFASHFRNQASQMTTFSDGPTVDVVQSLIDDLLAAISKEGEVLSAMYQKLCQLARDFLSLPISDVLKRLAVILVDGVLSSAQVVIDALFDVLSNLAGAALNLLDTRVHIPVISDILNEIGIPNISLLDLLLWICAVGYTVVYKIANNLAPFQDDIVTHNVITASSWSSLIAQVNPTVSTTCGGPSLGLKDEQKQPNGAFSHKTTPPNLKQHLNSDVPHGAHSLKLRNQSNGSDSHRARSLQLQRQSPKDSLSARSPATSSSLRETIFIAGHSMGGFLAFSSDFVNTFEASAPTADNEWSTLSTVINVVKAVATGAADVLAPKDPIENTFVADCMKGTTAAGVVSQLIFCGPAQKRFKASSGKFAGLAVEDGRATGAIVDAILVVPALCITCYHFSELSAKPAGRTRSAAIVGEVSNLGDYVSRVSYAAAVNDKDPESKEVEVGVMAAANLAVAGLQTAEAVIG